MSRRPAMLASAVRDLVAPVLRSCPPECGIVTITEVQVSRDFSYATLSISALNNVEVALEFLEQQLPELQRTMSALNRKKIPLLRFRIDPRTERGSTIDRLLDGDHP
jgi:ribosome-binding factor A